MRRQHQRVTCVAFVATYTVQSQHHSLTLSHITDTFMYYYIKMYIDTKWHLDCIKLCHKSLLFHINNKDIHVVLGRHGYLANSSTVTHLEHCYWKTQSPNHLKKWVFKRFNKSACFNSVMQSSKQGAGSEQTELYWDRTGRAGLFGRLGRVEGNEGASASIRNFPSMIFFLPPTCFFQIGPIRWRIDTNQHVRWKNWLCRILSDTHIWRHNADVALS